MTSHTHGTARTRSTRAAGWRRIGSIAALLLAFLAALPAHAEQRIALIIGNASYPDSPLENPVNDAVAVAAALERLGFETVSVTDANLRSMQAAVLEFSRRIEEDATALVFYAGHGIQANGRNYLVPVDASLDDEAALSFEALELGDVLERLEYSPSRLNIVVLDACRNNPFLRRFRGGSRGLAAVDAASGTLIAYATAPGSVASDGSGENGLYTQHLLQALNEPGLQAEALFKQVRIGVSEASGGAQIPWESSSLTGDFVFNRARGVQRVQPAAVADAPAPAASPGVDVAAIAAGAEVVFWDSVREATDIASFRAYLAQYPNGTFAALAEARIAALQADADALSGAAPPPPQTVAGATTRSGNGQFLDIRNTTGFAMTDLRVSPTSSTSWEQNFLAGARLENGQTYRADLGAYSSATFDVRLTDTDGDTYTFRNVDVAQQTLTVSLGDIDGTAAAGSGTTSTTNNYYVDVTNRTGYTIMFLNVSHSDSTSWGADVLGSEVLANGATRRVDLQGYPNPIFDIRATDSDGDTYTFMKVDVSRQDLTITLQDIDGGGAAPAQSGNYYVDVTNRTGYTIMFLNVSHSDSSSWGADVLGSEVLANGATRRVDLQGYPNPIFDIRATDSDGDTYTFMKVDVSRQDITITLQDIDS